MRFFALTARTISQIASAIAESENYQDDKYDAGFHNFIQLAQRLGCAQCAPAAGSWQEQSGKSGAALGAKSGCEFIF